MVLYSFAILIKDPITRNNELIDASFLNLEEKISSKKKIKLKIKKRKMFCRTYC